MDSKRALQTRQEIAQLRQRLAEAEQALRESDRHRSRFLAMLSHELRNPLAPIKTALYVLERSPPGSDAAQRAQAVIGRQVGVLSRLVDELLDPTRAMTDTLEPKRERIDLNHTVREAVQEHIPRGPATAPGAAGCRRILVVEDNADAAESLRELLRMSGHAVEIAYSGPEGLAKARELRPEVVLCDIGLPGMDGYAVAQAIRAEASLSGMLLVAVSGYAQPEDLERAREAGFDHHVAKPPSMERLEALLGAR